MNRPDEESYEYLEELKADLLADKDFRYSYAESLLNSQIAAQIKVLREQRKMTQEDLALAAGTKQSGISRCENVNHSAWKTEMLWKLAKALDVRLKVSFEGFGSLVDELDHFNRASMERPMPADDRQLASPRPRSMGIADKAWTSDRAESAVSKLTSIDASSKFDGSTLDDSLEMEIAEPAVKMRIKAR